MFPGSGTRIMIIEIDGQELPMDPRLFVHLLKIRWYSMAGRQSWPAARGL